MSFVPRAIFLTKGIGRHKEELASFEEALRDAKIAPLNLVNVSSIFPPYCVLVSRERGLSKFKDGQATFCVLARNKSNEHHRLISASIGLAIPTDRNQHGYLSEHHDFGKTEEETGDYAEDLAASMLASTLGLKFDTEANWDKKKEIWKISGQIVKTTNCTQSAIGKKGFWTTVISAAVLIP
ncbi:MAG: arginine decarboxylase, pyruvoyl-dependent [Planctomycetes bacterium]|nr:arginine decarboxylase, pyruvoyl-dependent [Planctomycetota bacterium]